MAQKIHNNRRVFIVREVSRVLTTTGKEEAAKFVVVSVVELVPSWGDGRTTRIEQT